MISIVQIGLYLFLDNKKIKNGKSIAFATLLMGHLFILPQFFFPEPDPNGINCGMPVLGITLAFWVIGGGATVLMHILYFFLRKLIRGK